MFFLFSLIVLLSADNATSTLGDSGTQIFHAVQSLAQTIDDAVINLIKLFAPDLPTAFGNVLLNQIVLDALSFIILVGMILGILFLVLRHLSKIIIIIVFVVVLVILLVPVFPV